MPCPKACYRPCFIRKAKYFQWTICSGTAYNRIYSRPRKAIHSRKYNIFFWKVQGYHIMRPFFGAYRSCFKAHEVLGQRSVPWLNLTFPLIYFCWLSQNRNIKDGQPSSHQWWSSAGKANMDMTLWIRVFVVKIFSAPQWLVPGST